MTKQHKKEPVTIRFKTLNDGSKSIYLDIYQDGKRSYQFLKLYLIPDTSPQATIQNKNTMQAANVIKSQMIIDIANGVAGITQTQRKASKTTLQQWVQDCIETKQNGNTKPGTIVRYQYIKKYLGEYNPKATLKDIDKDFCLGFIHFLEERMKPITAKTQFSLFTALLNKAVREGIIDKNPVTLLESDEKIKVPDYSRDYLEIDEIKALMNSDFRCKNDLREAFFFSCFCGLAYAEICNLKWKDIQTGGKQTQVRYLRGKTQVAELLPLSENAIRFLPKRGEAPLDSPVFNMPTQPYTSYLMKKWTTPLFPNKRVTFHTARHTFATMMLTLGADLYTVSKLLGHRKILTTQIYTKIIDEKKANAVNLTNGLF